MGREVEVHSGVALTTYDPAKCLRIVAGVADGEKSLKDLCKEHGVARATFYRWLAMYSDLRSAYNAARLVSAGEFEDQALAIARKLETEKEITGTRVAAYKAAMEQYRWSAGHRDPAAYGMHTQINIAVPVTITTPLDLGNGVTNTMPVTATSENVYQITAMVDIPDEPSNDAETADGDDPFDTTAREEPLVPKKHPGRPPKKPRDPGPANQRASRYAARKNLHPRAREILEQRKEGKVE